MTVPEDHGVLRVRPIRRDQPRAVAFGLACLFLRFVYGCIIELPLPCLASAAPGGIYLGRNGVVSVVGAGSDGVRVGRASHLKIRGGAAGFSCFFRSGFSERRVQLGPETKCDSHHLQ
jgi:hypothetical protein